MFIILKYINIFNPFQEDLMCSAAVCDSQEAAFHRAKGCQPIVEKGEVHLTFDFF